MYEVQRLDPDGSEVETHHRITSSAAVRLYYRVLHRNKGQHVRLIRSGNLPGLEPEVIAERFGT